MGTEISQLWDIDSGEYMVKIVCTENLNPRTQKTFDCIISSCINLKITFCLSKDQLT